MYNELFQFNLDPKQKRPPVTTNAINFGNYLLLSSLWSFSVCVCVCLCIIEINKYNSNDYSFKSPLSPGFIIIYLSTLSLIAQKKKTTLSRK